MFMCTPKEPHFLINNEIGKDRIPIGICSENEYLDLFLEGRGEKYRGESSVMYLMFPEIVIPKINQQFGKECKIIIMLRNPIERAYSGFQHVKRYNVKEDCTDFKSAWSVSEERYFSNPEMTPASRYKELGLYHKQVKSYLDGVKNVHIIIYDDYQNDFQNEMNKVFNFLAIKKVEINSEKNIFIDEDALIAFEDKLEIKTISRGVKELITSGEGFLFAISGKGKVWIQTREKGEHSSSGGIIDGIFNFMK